MSRSTLAVHDAVFTHTLRVRHGECDPQGIVFNPNYLMYLDVAMTEWWRELVGSPVEMVGRGLDMVLSESTVHYLLPARADDVVSVGLRPTHVGTTSFVTEGSIKRDDDLLTSSTLRHVFVDATTLRPRPMPPVVADVLHALRRG